MGALVAALAPEARSPAPAVRAMLERAPHRGSLQRTVEVGPCAIGIRYTPEPADTSIAKSPLGKVAAIVGNLDNRHELLEELRQQGVPPTGDDAAGVVLAVMQRLGPESVRRFRGAFAGVFWDGTALWCFRDHVGFQPLFYRSDAAGFFCASEAKQVAAGAGVIREPDLDALEWIYYRGTGERTAIKGVNRFFPACLAQIDREGKVTARRFWDPSPLLESARIGIEDARERLEGLLAQAVARTVSGNDLISLSGGLDSPTVAAFAAPVHLRRSGKVLRAFSAFFPDHPSVDESALTGEVADRLGIPLHSYVLRAGPLDDVGRWTDLADGPWDTLPAAAVVEEYRLARQLGAQTVLTGELAEYVYTMSGGLLGHLLWHGRWRPLAAYAAALRAAGSSWRAIGRRVVKESVPGSLGAIYTRLTDRRNLRFPSWLDVTAVGGTSYRTDLSGPVRKRWAYAQLAPTWGTSSNVEVDEILAAYCGIRVRRPLADVDLWEFFLSLPAEVKFPNTTSKPLIRQVMQGRLPDRIIFRRQKTLFDEYVMRRADYGALRRLIDPSRFRMRGVDYDALQARLDAAQLSLTDLPWAYNLARVHAFVESLGRGSV